MTPEEKARVKIDQMFEDSGWQVVDRDLRLAMTAAIRKVFTEEPSVFDPRKYLTPARDQIEETVSHKIRDVFGSSNKA